MDSGVDVDVALHQLEPLGYPDQCNPPKPAGFELLVVCIPQIITVYSSPWRTTNAHQNNHQCAPIHPIRAEMLGVHLGRQHRRSNLGQAVVPPVPGEIGGPDAKGAPELVAMERLIVPWMKQIPQLTFNTLYLQSVALTLTVSQPLIQGRGLAKTTLRCVYI